MFICIKASDPCAIQYKCIIENTHTHTTLQRYYVFFFIYDKLFDIMTSFLRHAELFQVMMQLLTS